MYCQLREIILHFDEFLATVLFALWTRDNIECRRKGNQPSISRSSLIRKKKFTFGRQIACGLFLVCVDADTNHNYLIAEQGTVCTIFLSFMRNGEKPTKSENVRSKGIWIFQQNNLNEQVVDHEFMMAIILLSNLAPECVTYDTGTRCYGFNGSSTQNSE